MAYRMHMTEGRTIAPQAMQLSHSALDLQLGVDDVPVGIPLMGHASGEEWNA